MPGHRPEQNEMQFLQEICNPDIYLRNAFRVTGLDVTVSPKDAKRFAKEREQRHLLGISQSTPTQSPFPLPTPPSDEDIRHAIDHRISHPYRRLVDELFWFWPKSETTTNAAFQSLQKGDRDTAKQIWLGDIKSGERNSNSLHNLAVIYHITVLEMETARIPSRTTTFSCPHCKLTIDATPAMFGKDTDCQHCGKRLHIPQKKPLHPETEAQITTLWKSTYSCWTQLWINMEFWAEVTTRAKQIDETITPDKIEILRQQLPEALLSINAQLAHDYCNAGMHSDAERQARTIWESKFSERHRQDAVRNSTRHTITQLHAISASAESRAQGKPEDGLKIVTELLEKTRPLLNSLRALNLHDVLTLDHAARDAVANAGMTALIAYANMTNDWDPLVAPNREVIDLAHSEALKTNLRKNLSTLEENVRGKVLERELKPLRELCDTLNKETAFVWGQVQGPDLTPEAKFHSFKQDALPKLDELKRRLGVASEAAKAGGNICAVCLRGLSVDLHNKSNNYTLAVEAIEMALRLCSDPDEEKTLQKDRQICHQHVREKAAAETKARNTMIAKVAAWIGGVAVLILIAYADSCSSPSGTSTSTTTYNPGNQSRPYNNSQTYRPSPSPYRQALSQEIDSGKAKAHQLETQMTSLDNQIDGYKRRMDNYMISGMIDEYNALVPMYNGLVEDRNTVYNQYKALIADVNAKVKEHNSNR